MSDVRRESWTHDGTNEPHSTLDFAEISSVIARHRSKSNRDFDHYLWSSELEIWGYNLKVIDPKQDAAGPASIELSIKLVVCLKVINQHITNPAKHYQKIQRVHTFCLVVFIFIERECLGNLWLTS